MRSVEAWKRKQLKGPKFKADALEEEFALAAKKIEARKKKRASVCATPLKPVPRRGAARQSKN